MQDYKNIVSRANKCILELTDSRSNSDTILFDEDT